MCGLVKYYLNQFFKLSSLVALGHGGEPYKGVVSKSPNWFIQIDAVVGKIALQADDIVSMNGGPSNYGHVALVKSVSGNTVTFAEQYDGSVTVLRRTKTYTSENLSSSDYCYLYGAARPIF